MARFSVPSGGGGGDVSFDEGCIVFPNDGEICNTENSSGDGYGNSTISIVPDKDLYDNDQYLIIDPTAPNHIHIRAGGTQDDSNAELYLGGEKTYVRINDNYGVARMQASYVYSSSYSSGDWTSAFVIEDEFNRYIEITDPAEYILEFLSSSTWNNSNEVFYGFNGGERLFSYGINTTETTYVIYLEPSGTPNDPITVNTLEFYYENRSRIEIDMNDDEEIAIRGNGIDVNIFSSKDIEIGANEGISIESGDNLSIDANNDIVLYSENGGQFLNDNESPNNQIATLGDVGVETSYEVQGGTDGTQPTFTGDPLFSASYIKMSSNLVHFQIQVDMDNITSFGTGQYYMTLPFTSKYGYKFRDGCLHDFDTGRTYHISGHVYPNSDQITLYSTDVSGQNLYDFPFAQGEPITLSTADNFHIAGTYICE
jgi:hypothetical protein